MEDPMMFRETTRSPLLAALGCALALALAACSKESAPPAPPEAPQVAPPDTTPSATSGTVTPPAATATDPNSELEAKVKSEFFKDPDLKTLPADVRASNGKITIYGTADSEAERKRAGAAAARVPGVKSVDNQLKIVRGS
jgi:hypothetical protein